MLLAIHIIIALSSVAFATYLLLKPTKAKLPVSYMLAGLTLGTGVGLVLASPVHMVQACVSGIVYVSVVTILTVATQVRLSRVRA